MFQGEFEGRISDIASVMLIHPETHGVENAGVMTTPLTYTMMLKEVPDSQHTVEVQHHLQIMILLLSNIFLVTNTGTCSKCHGITNKYMRLGIVVLVVVYVNLSRLLYLAYSANLGLLGMPHPSMGPLF